MIRELIDNLRPENLHPHVITCSLVAATFEPAWHEMAESSAGECEAPPIIFEIPDSCLQGLADVESGRVVDLDTSLTQSPPSD